jgi:DNA primase
MARYTKEAVIAYDSDAAGVAAAQRAIGLLGKTGLSIKVLRYSGAKDPDEFIRQKGREAFSLLIEGSENHVAYRLAVVQAKYDLMLDEQRVEFIKEAAELLSGLENPVEREIYGARAADAAKVSRDAMALEIKRAYGVRMKKNQKKNERSELNPVKTAQPKERDLRYEDNSSAFAEEGLLAILLSAPECIEKTSEQLSPDDFSSPFLGRLFEKLTKRYFDGRSLSVAALSQDFSPGEMAQITKFILRPVDNSNIGRAIEDQIKTIKNQRMKRLALVDDESLRKLAESKRSGG